MGQISMKISALPGSVLSENQQHAIKLFADDLLEPSERLDCAQNMLAALARDTLAMGASA